MVITTKHTNKTKKFIRLIQQYKSQGSTVRHIWNNIGSNIVHNDITKHNQTH